MNDGIREIKFNNGSNIKLPDNLETNYLLGDGTCRDIAYRMERFSYDYLEKFGKKPPKKRLDMMIREAIMTQVTNERYNLVNYMRVSND